jgi:hypothetical protein
VPVCVIEHVSVPCSEQASAVSVWCVCALHPPPHHAHTLHCPWASASPSFCLRKATAIELVSISYLHIHRHISKTTWILWLQHRTRTLSTQNPPPPPSHTPAQDTTHPPTHPPRAQNMPGGSGSNHLTTLHPPIPTHPLAGVEPTTRERMR